MDANKISLFHKVSRVVHDKDEMFVTLKKQLPETGKAFHFYFYCGGLVAQNLENFLIDLGHNPQKMSILDYASGYGRISRYFVKIFNKCTVSDIESQMLKFQEENFGVESFLAYPDLRKSNFLGKQFDIVFSFSLFTHLHPSIWFNWLQALSQCVANNGYLFFSTRSKEFARSKGEEFKGQFNYTEKNENPARLDVKKYGQMSVTYKYVEQQVSKLDQKFEYIQYFPKGEFDLYQDMHVIKRI